jgi:hypothetical protein
MGLTHSKLSLRQFLANLKLSGKGNGGKPLTENASFPKDGDIGDQSASTPTNYMVFASLTDQSRVL